MIEPTELGSQVRDDDGDVWMLRDDGWAMVDSAGSSCFPYLAGIAWKEILVYGPLELTS
jgi:hypothetical protein